MLYRNLGRTKLNASVIGLGCGSFAGIGSEPSCIGKGASLTESFLIMDRALELGINFFDTADSYAGGLSEEYIGKWLKAKGSSVRDKLLVASKVGCPIGPAPHEKGLSRERILQQIDVSLLRLGVDYLDMYLIHEPDPLTPVEETLTALNDLIKSGKVKYIGGSNMSFAQVKESNEVCRQNNFHRFEWIQNGYNLLERKDETGLIPYCILNEIGYTPFSPLAGGWLTGKYFRGQKYPDGSRMESRPGAYLGFLSDEIFTRLEKFGKYCLEKGNTMGAVALAWNFHQPGVTALLTGPKKISNLDLAEEAINLSLTKDELSQINSIFNNS